MGETRVDVNDGVVACGDEIEGVGVRESLAGVTGFNQQFTNADMAALYSAAGGTQAAFDTVAASLVTSYAAKSAWVKLGFFTMCARRRAISLLVT